MKLYSYFGCVRNLCVVGNKNIFLLFCKDFLIVLVFKMEIVWLYMFVFCLLEMYWYIIFRVNLVGDFCI